MKAKLTNSSMTPLGVRPKWDGPSGSGARPKESMHVAQVAEEHEAVTFPHMMR